MITRTNQLRSTFVREPSVIADRYLRYTVVPDCFTRFSISRDACAVGHRERRQFRGCPTPIGRDGLPTIGTYAGARSTRRNSAFACTHGRCTVRNMHAHVLTHTSAYYCIESARVRDKTGLGTRCAVVAVVLGGQQTHIVTERTLFRAFFS